MDSSTPPSASDTPAGTSPAGEPPPQEQRPAGGNRVPLTVRSRRLTPAQAVAVTRERLLWNQRADSWDTDGSAGLTKVVERVLATCICSSETVAIDLGCGSGAVTIPLARDCASVLGIDVSAPLLARLEEKALTAGVKNIQTITHPIETLDLSPNSVDLIVTNYALHHLRDTDKAELMRRSYQWLRPGGQLVIGDMMFGRGGNAEDRAIIASKVQGMLRHGPAGWWRIAKNVWRFSLRLGEKPLPVTRWESLVKQAGFHEVAVTHVVEEAHVLSAVKPPADTESGGVQDAST